MASTFDLLERDRVIGEEFELGDSQSEAFAERYCEDILEAFKASPEATSLSRSDEDIGSWVFHFTRYALEHLGIGLSQVQRDDLEEIVDVGFPRQISIIDPAEADTIIPELMAFWNFLKREYALPEADDLLQELARHEPGYGKRMLDPTRFGPAKGFVMAGQAAGYDMTDKDQMGTT